MRKLPRSKSTIPLHWSRERGSSALRSIRNDPLGRMHSHRHIDEAQYQGGRAFQNDWEKAERGPRAVDPTREYVDGGQAREPITEGQRKAVLRLNRAERELGADGSALVHEVLILGMTMEQIGQRRGLRTQRWNRLFRAAIPRMPRSAGADVWICDTPSDSGQEPSALKRSGRARTYAGLFQPCAAKAFQIMLAVGVQLPWQLGGDPGE